MTHTVTFGDSACLLLQAFHRLRDLRFLELIHSIEVQIVLYLRVCAYIHLCVLYGVSSLILDVWADVDLYMCEGACACVDVCACVCVHVCVRMHAYCVIMTRCAHS